MRQLKPDAVQDEKAEQVLKDLYELVELYAPMWYSEQLRERIESAVGHS